MQIPGELDRGHFCPGFYLHLVPEAWQRGGQEVVAEEGPG